MTEETEKASSVAPTWTPDGRVESADILFVGDTGFGESYRSAHSTGLEDLYDAPFAELQPLLSAADFVVANLETVLTDRRESPLDGKRPYLHYDDPAAGGRSLVDHNIGAVTFANNHIMDMGEDGFLDTLSTLEDNGILYAGAGRDRDRAQQPLRLIVPFEDGTEQGITVFAGFRTSSDYNELTGSYATADSPGCASLRTGTVTAQIRAAREAHPNELIVVIPHWRRDYKWASSAQRKFANDVTDAGADLVIGHGSHMAQEIDIVDGRIRLHGIGNFVFNSNGRYSKEGVPPYSILTRLRLASSGASIRLYPIHTNNRATGFRSHHLSDEQFDEFYRTAVARTRASSTFLKAAAPGRDEYGPYLDVPLGPDRRTMANRLQTGIGSTLTAWEEAPEQMEFDRTVGHTTVIVQRELDKRGATYERLGQSALVGASQGGVPFLLKNVMTHQTGAPGNHAAGRKDLARALMARADVSIAAGEYFADRQDFDEAKALMEQLGSVVVKPVDGNIGRGVTVGVTTEEEMADAWAFAFGETRSGVLVEEQFMGEDVRISVVDGVAHAANNRIPPQVVGDGTSTIRELINSKNDIRYQDVHLHPKPIEMTAYRLKRMDRAGFTLNSVLPAGETFVLDPKGNLATGAEPADVTDEIHPSYLRMAERAVLAFPGVDIAGVDVLGSDFSTPATPENHIVVEMNTNPDVGSHGTAFKGRPRDVVGPAVDSFLTPRPVGPFAPRLRRPDIPASPSSVRLLGAEFAARGMEIDWVDSTYFHARSGDSLHTVWRSTTDRTGQSSHMILGRQDWTDRLLTRASVPTALSRVFGANEGAKAHTFAQRFAACTLQTSKRSIDIDPSSASAFDDAWSELTTSGRRGGIRVSQKHEGSRLRMLIAHGRALTALDPSSPEGLPQDVLGSVDPSHRAIAAAAATAFPGLDLAEVTLTVRDASVPAVRGATVVERVASRPNIAEHWRAASEEGRDIVETIVDLHLGSDGPAREGEFALIEEDHHATFTDSLREKAAGARRGLRRAAGSIRRRIS